MNKKHVLVTIALMLVMCIASIGGTIAWLTATDDPVTNTFTPSSLDLTLVETTTDYKMVPGDTISKDPKVTVTTDVPAWLFVKVTESTQPDLDNFITWSIANGWTALETYNDTASELIYYREVSATGTFEVLSGNSVTVKDSVTDDMMDAITGDNVAKPTLKFDAYAIQKEGFSTAALAWAEITNTSGN